MQILLAKNLCKILFLLPIRIITGSREEDRKIRLISKNNTGVNNGKNSNFYRWWVHT
jgi:hypothetical protein